MFDGASGPVFGLNVGLARPGQERPVSLDLCNGPQGSVMAGPKWGIGSPNDLDIHLRIDRRFLICLAQLEA